MRKTLVAIMTAALLVSCGQKETATPDAAAATPAQNARAQAGVVTPSTPAQSAAAAPAAASAAASGGAMAGAKLAGTVAETMNSGGYTYIRLKSAQGDVWVATPQSEVKKGQQLTIHAQMTAEKFESSSLKRTFDRIVFGTIDAGPQPRVAAASPMAAGMPPGHPSMPGAAMNAMGTPADHMKASAKIGDVNVPKAEGANAKTVAEAWSGRAGLAGKEVVVRGKVVKFLGGIMGTNFLHVRDGSGSAEKGDHDLTVTTNDVAAVGDVVTVSGTLLVDKDFGAGYKYPVIVENARIRK